LPEMMHLLSEADHRYAMHVDDHNFHGNSYGDFGIAA
jgi:hypothetical protein